MYACRTHVAYGLGNLDKDGGNLSPSIVVPGRDRGTVHQYRIQFRVVLFSGLTTLCDVVQE